MVNLPKFVVPLRIQVDYCTATEHIFSLYQMASHLADVTLYNTLDECLLVSFIF